MGCAVTVLLPTYQGAAFVEEQVRSLVRQTRPPDVLLVYDDGSTDETLDRVARAARGAPFVLSVKAAENVGWVANCERALAAAETDLVAFCDQDDVWLPTKLERQLHLMHDERLDLVFGNAAVVDANLRRLGTTLQAAELRALQQTGPLASLLRYNLVQNATILGRAAMFRRLMPTPACMTFDAWLGLGTAALGRIGVVRDPLLLYRQHGTNQLGATTGVHRWLSLAGNLLTADELEHRSTQLARYRNARDRLLSLGVDPSVAAALDAKVAHLERRARLPERRVARAMPILAEVVGDHYHRYGRGWRGALRDLAAKRSAASA